MSLAKQYKGRIGFNSSIKLIDVDRFVFYQLMKAAQVSLIESLFPTQFEKFSFLLKNTFLILK